MSSQVIAKARELSRRRLWTISMAACSILLVAVSAAPAQEVPPGLKYVPPGAFAAATTQPAAVLKLEALQMLPIEVMQAAVLQELNIDPLQVKRVVAFAEGPIHPVEPPGYGLAIEFLERVDAVKILPKFREVPPNLPPGSPMQTMWPRIEAVSETLVLVAPEKTLPRMKQAAGGELSDLQKRLSRRAAAHAALVVTPAPVRNDLQQILQQMPEMPGPLGELRNLPQLIEALEFSVELGEQFRSQLIVQGSSPAAADTLEQLVAFGLQMLRFNMLSGLQPASPDDPVAVAGNKYAERIANQFIASLTPKRDGNTLTIQQDASVSVAAVGVTTALLLPAVQAARGAARRATSMNNLKQLSIAFLMYHDRYNKFPERYSADATGKPLLSWRVHLLPYLEQEQLYRQFKLDEPWDSPHNRQLIQQMPPVYTNPDGLEPGMTNYLVPVGPGTLYEKPAAPGMNALSRTVGVSNTVLLVEANAEQAVPWTKPDDLPFDRKDPVRGLGKFRPGNIFLAAFCDGAVRTFEIQDFPEAIKRLAPLAKPAD